MLSETIGLTLFPATMAFAAASDLLTMTIANRISIVLVAGCGRAAMWSRGCFAAAPRRVVLRPAVRMMQTHILERARSRRFASFGI